MKRVKFLSLDYEGLLELRQRIEDGEEFSFDIGVEDKLITCLKIDTRLEEMGINKSLLEKKDVLHQDNMVPYLNSIVRRDLSVIEYIDVLAGDNLLSKLVQNDETLLVVVLSVKNDEEKVEFINQLVDFLSPNQLYLSIEDIKPNNYDMTKIINKIMKSESLLSKKKVRDKITSHGMKVLEYSMEEFAKNNL